MLPLSSKTKKYLRYFSSAILVGGMAMVTGFLSFTGMLVLDSSIYYAIAAFFLAGGIEGEVYAKNITGSLFMLFSENYMENALLNKKLANLVKDIDEEHPSVSPFLNNYKKLLDYIAKAEANPNNEEYELVLMPAGIDLGSIKPKANKLYVQPGKNGLLYFADEMGKPEAIKKEELKSKDTSTFKNLKVLKDDILKITTQRGHTPDGEEQLKNAKRSLKWMRTYFKEFMNDQRPDPTLSLFIKPEHKLALGNETRKKAWLSRLSWVLNLGAGLSCGLVSLEVAQSSILAIAAHFGLVISGAALSASVFGLAIIGAISYTLMIHNTINNMIQNNTLQKWAKKTAAFFVRKDEESNTLLYALRVIGGALVVTAIVGLGIFATAATAGTWWYAAKTGAKMIPWIANFASEIRTTAVLTMGITTLIFNIKNSLKSVKELTEISIRNAYHQSKEQVQEYQKAENPAQFINIPRFIIQVISIPFKLFTFIAHLYSMGAMNNNLAGVSPQVTTGMSATCEGLTDFHVIFPENHRHPHTPQDKHCSHPHGISKPRKAHHHNHQNGYSHHHQHQNGHSHHETTPKHSSEEKTHRHPHQHKHHGHDHDHEHADLAGKLLKLALSPLYLLAALWDYSLSQRNTGDKKRLTFKQAVKKSFLGLPKHIQKPKLSSTWLRFEKQARVQKTIAKHSSKLCKQSPDLENTADLENIDELRRNIIAPSPDAPAPAYVGQDGTINSNTFFNNRPMSPAAHLVCEKIIQKANCSQYRTLIQGG